MRTFEDNQGKRWQATLLNGSYGNIALLFSPIHGQEIHHLPWDVENIAEGENRLADLDDDGLRALLSEAAPWDPASGAF